VIDLDYCYSNYLSSLKGGDIEIDTSLPCLEIDSNNPEYSSYLAVMSGSQLVEIYEEYGQKLLEQNVRTFLMFRTKVNQGLKETIRKIPERFFAYNNGITGTASEVQIVNGKITKLKGFQIVNGGQTTSSIYYCAKNENFDISAVNVQLKLSVIKENEKHTDFVDSVAKYANTQNAIKDADFSSNSPFHIQFKQWSKRVLVPSVDGSQNRTYWHYERVRGEYLNDQAYLEPSKRKKFLLDHPNRITKINLPMSEVSWMQKPDIVSKKSGAAFKFFGAKITDEIAKDNLFITEDYYKDVISRVIMYRDVRRLIQNSSWYETGSYLAATVTYSMSFLAFEVSKTGQYFNFKKIWEVQYLPTALEQIFKNITSKVYASIHKPEEGYPNLDSWHKRTGCFDKVKKDLSDIKIMKLDVFLVTKDIVKTEKKDQRKDRKFVDAVTKHMFVVHEEGENKKLWASLLEFYREDDNPTVMKLDILTKFTTGLLLPKKISRKQAVVIYDIYENAKENGWIEHD
jgi:copper chaperone CopZ